MKTCLKWNGSLSKELVKLVEDKAQGNPLMIKEVRCCVCVCVDYDLPMFIRQVMITLAGKGKLCSMDNPDDALGTPPTPRPGGLVAKSPGRYGGVGVFRRSPG